MLLSKSNLPVLLDFDALPEGCLNQQAPADALREESLLPFFNHIFT